MYGPRPIRFPAHWCADYSKYRGFLAGGISNASSLLPFFFLRLQKREGSWKLGRLKGRVMQIYAHDHVEVYPEKKKEVLYSVKWSAVRIRVGLLILSSKMYLYSYSSGGGTGYSGSLRGNSINLRGEYINADDVMHLIKIGWCHSLN